VFSCYASREFNCGLLRHVFLSVQEICRAMFPGHTNLTLKRKGGSVLVISLGMGGYECYNGNGIRRVPETRVM